MNVGVVNLFVSLCQIHQDHYKPTQSPELLSLIELHVMDFCECKNVHTWVMNIIDLYTKFVTVVPLQQKTADEVLKGLREYCYTYRFPKRIITDNGGEFQNKKLKMFCKDNGIELSHGAPQTLTTQGLTERREKVKNSSPKSLLVYCRPTVGRQHTNS